MGDLSVHFETAAGVETRAVSGCSVLPSCNPADGNDDLALLWLKESAPVGADRYDLYRATDEIGQTLTLAGYGKPGSGAAGLVTDYTGSPLRLFAQNRVDADAGTLKAGLWGAMAWTPAPGTQLVADFDNGTAAQDALGALVGLRNTGLGSLEGLITPGDSGGPAFIGGKVAGIASYTANLELGSVHPDIDTVSDSSFGEMGFWQRVSAYQKSTQAVHLDKKRSRHPAKGHSRQ